MFLGTKIAGYNIMMRFGCRLSILYALLVFGFASLEAQPCRVEISRLAIESALPKLSTQKDIRFYHAGYFNGGKTFLCGPTCLLNLGIILNETQGGASTDPIAEMGRLLSSADAILEAERSIIQSREGLPQSILQKLADEYSKALGFSSDISSKVILGWFDVDRDGIQISELLSENSSNAVILMVAQIHPVEGHQMGIGHAVLAIRDPSDSQKLMLLDPLYNPPRITHSTLQPARVYGSPQTFILENQALADSNPESTYFIQGLIKISNIRRIQP